MCQDEHGIVLPAKEGVSLPALGQVLRLIPGHVDPTFSLWDHVIGFRDEIVTNIIDIDARGRSD